MPFGGYGDGYTSGMSGYPGMQSPLLTPQFGVSPWSMPWQNPVGPAPYSRGDRRELGPGGSGAAGAPGCASATYQTVSNPRPSGPDVRTVVANSGGAGVVRAPGVSADQDSKTVRRDGEDLSPIEASFQLGPHQAQTLSQAVFASQRVPAVLEMSTATPSAVPLSPPPAPVVSGGQGQNQSQNQNQNQSPAQAPNYAAGTGGSGAPGSAQGASSAAADSSRFLGPFGTPLRQFGYAAFASHVSTFAPVDDIPVGPDYVLGPGDDLAINIWGPVESTVVRTVDRNGRIVLPKVGDLRVWGLTFAQADRVIREQLSRYFRSFNTSITMGRLRALRVQVVGEVCQPGSYHLSALATLTNALYSAGGPTKLGSLRTIRLLRNGHEVGTMDLYDFLLRGDRTRDFRLESGDTIFVPTVGEVAAVAGEVKRPAIYEIRGDLRVADLLEAAGGVTPTSYLKRVQIIRAQPSAERLTLDLDLTSYYLKGDMASNPPVNGGDLVLIHRSEARIYNTVKLDGAVRYPGVYELKPMMRVSQLLSADQLLPEAYADRIEITRRRPDFSTEIVSIDLKKAWGGDRDQDVLLRPSDEITVRTERRAARTVTLAGQVMRPGTYVIAEGERLSSLLDRAGGFTGRAYLRGAVFTRQALRRIEQEQLNAFVRVQEQRILATASTVVVGSDKEEAAISAQTVTARREMLRALAARVALGRMVVRLGPLESLKNTGDDIVLSDGDALEIPEPVGSVQVVGAVRNATSVLYSDGADVQYYVNRVGGLVNEADKREIHIVKADGSAIAGFANIRSVEAGDTIIVPPKEESKIRLLPTIRDSLSILGSALSGALSLAALTVLFP
jgi:protein involved in polysaccharide export with SLBB domain